MKKKLYIKILEFLNNQEDILSYTDLKELVSNHYINLKADKKFDFQVVQKEIYSVLKILRDKNFIEFEDNRNHRVVVISNGDLKEEHFTIFEASPRITVEGINYLQSEQDAQVTREFIKAQKEFLLEQFKQARVQTKIIKRSFYISILSLIFIAITTVDTIKGGIEQQLKELVKSQRDLRTTLKDSLTYPSNLPIQTSTSKPLQKTSK